MLPVVDEVAGVMVMTDSAENKFCPLTLTLYFRVILDEPEFVKDPVLYVVLVAPEISVHVLPLSVLNCHCREVTPEEPEWVMATELPEAIVSVAGLMLPVVTDTSGVTVMTD